MDLESGRALRQLVAAQSYPNEARLRRARLGAINLVAALEERRHGRALEDGLRLVERLHLLLRGRLHDLSIESGLAIRVALSMSLKVL